MKKFIKSFVYALDGLRFAIYSQRNIRLHLLAVATVTVAGIYFNITANEWIAVCLCFALVISLELVNTAIELLADKLHPEKDFQIGKVKDIAAGAVLAAAVFSAVVAFFIFGKYFL